MSFEKPRAVFLIHYRQGFPENGDYTKPARVEERTSLFWDAKTAGHFLDALDAWPSFHSIENVYRVGVPNWIELDPKTDLPRKQTKEKD